MTRLLRSCHEALQSLQLQVCIRVTLSLTLTLPLPLTPHPNYPQELYSAYTSHVHRTAIVIHSPDPGCATCVCRLCEHLVLAEMLQGHTQICRIVSQCNPSPSPNPNHDPTLTLTLPLPLIPYP